jgi:hypothetical protein
MIGLMTLWFGPFVDLQPDYGYFHLCPTCYRIHVRPHMDRVQGRLAELHPLAHHLGLHQDRPDTDPDTGPAPDPAPDTDRGSGQQAAESAAPVRDESRRAVAGS